MYTYMSLLSAAIPIKCPRLYPLGNFSLSSQHITFNHDPMKFTELSYNRRQCAITLVTGATGVLYHESLPLGIFYHTNSVGQNHVAHGEGLIEAKTLGLRDFEGPSNEAQGSFCKFENICRRYWYRLLTQN